MKPLGITIPLFPSAEIMDEATERLVAIEHPAQACDDRTAYLLVIENQDTRVHGTIDGISELPRVVPEFNRGRLN